MAAERAVDKARELAASALEAPASDIEYQAGRFKMVGTDHGIELGALAAKHAKARVPLRPYPNKRRHHAIQRAQALLDAGAATVGAVGTTTTA